MENQSHTSLVSFIWSVADACLRDIYVRGKYRDIILPMTVIRRFDAVLEPKKQELLALKEKCENKLKQTKKSEPTIEEVKKFVEAESGLPFVNISAFTLKDLTKETNMQNLKANFLNYLDGFSANVQDILKKFEFYNQIDKMAETHILDAVINKFIDSRINLSPNPITNTQGNVLPGLDNHAMGTLFEELIRKFNEENNEEAGEHFTPRDVVELMGELAIVPIIDKITDNTYTLYDGACGTLGMCTVASEILQRHAKKHHKKVSIHLFGQEINPETYAISKADTLIKGENSDHIFFGSTLSNDGAKERTFDFMLSNPPLWQNLENRP